MRDQLWLESLFSEIWNTYFNDVAPYNEIRVVYGRRARTRLGSISTDPKHPGVSIIRVNGLFKDSNIPEMIVRATLVHELSHYAHGFNSGGTPKFRYPHAGGVMRKEFAERGLERLYIEQKQWLKESWPAVVKANFKPIRRYRRVFFKIR